MKRPMARRRNTLLCYLLLSLQWIALPIGMCCRNPPFHALGGLDVWGWAVALTVCVAITLVLVAALIRGWAHRLALLPALALSLYPVALLLCCLWECVARGTV